MSINPALRARLLRKKFVGNLNEGPRDSEAMRVRRDEAREEMERRKTQTPREQAEREQAEREAKQKAAYQPFRWRDQFGWIARVVLVGGIVIGGFLYVAITEGNYISIVIGMFLIAGCLGVAFSKTD